MKTLITKKVEHVRRTAKAPGDNQIAAIQEKESGYHKEDLEAWRKGHVGKERSAEDKTGSYHHLQTRWRVEADIGFTNLEDSVSPIRRFQE